MNFATTAKRFSLHVWHLQLRCNFPNYHAISLLSLTRWFMNKLERNKNGDVLLEKSCAAQSIIRPIKRFQFCSAILLNSGYLLWWSLLCWVLIPKILLYTFVSANFCFHYSDTFTFQHNSYEPEFHTFYILIVIHHNFYVTRVYRQQQ